MDFQQKADYRISAPNRAQITNDLVEMIMLYNFNWIKICLLSVTALEPVEMQKFAGAKVITIVAAPVPGSLFNMTSKQKLNKNLITENF
jgi:hypothetical protein